MKFDLEKFKLGEKEVVGKYKDGKVILDKKSKTKEIDGDYKQIKCPKTGNLFMLNKETNKIYDLELFKKGEKKVVAKLIDGKIAMKKVK